MNPYEAPRARLTDRPVDDVFPVEHEGFVGRGLGLRVPGLFKRPRLVVDGSVIEPKGRTYTLRDNAGNSVEMRLKANGLDPIPKVVIGDRIIAVVRPFTWYEYVAMGLPFMLVIVGGGLGVLFGMPAFYTSARVLRSDRPRVMRFGLSALVSLTAALGYMLAVVLFRLWLGSRLR